MEFSNGFFESHGMLIVTRNVSSSTRTGPILVKGFMHSLQDLRIAAHSEIIIGAPHSDTLINVRHMRLGKFFGQAIDIVEVAVGLILVLLIKLGIIEGLVVKFNSTMFMLNR